MSIPEAPYGWVKGHHYHIFNDQLQVMNHEPNLDTMTVHAPQPPSPHPSLVPHNLIYKDRVKFIVGVGFPHVTLDMNVCN